MQHYLYGNGGTFAGEFQFLSETLLNGMCLTVSTKVADIRWDCSCKFSFEAS